ncbi:hypothetical protein NADFUDRAFT_53158 [Nadsonia fulvescens var. elongata DSM 6958]|uniref:Cytoplasmic tRNA 2-thiolation protein 2 n=1 Tax=Nadsonia fulvescens var. elongata DSM 6958 TaxID=857566 RepID=A0A1E3PDG6_9ASCO|nr:hypothetical protein NADFUDRAFT_53158 [Nadsonia fulvescens var. elongata DSM 6958]
MLAENVVPCRRCKVEPSVVESRTEPFCKSCFLHFIQGKQYKQLDGFKVLYPAYRIPIPPPSPRILLPLSLGASSLALLDMLIILIEKQRKAHRGRQGFELIVLIIEENEESEKKEQYQAVANDLQEKYSGLCNIHSIPISEILKLSEDVLLKLHDNHITTIEATGTHPSSLDIKSIFSKFPSNTSRADALLILRNRLINAFAVSQKVQYIAWGHNQTRLAEEVICLTVKGRGNQVAQKLKPLSPDAEDFWTKEFIKTHKFSENDITHLYPLRDIMSSEITEYLKFRGVESLIKTNLNEYNGLSTSSASVITKAMTIDQLITRYFVDVQANFPSVISTVVRTGVKLADPLANEDLPLCLMCEQKVTENTVSWVRKITVNDSADLETDEEKAKAKEFFKLYPTMLQSPEETAKPEAKVCYSCLVSIRGAQEGEVSWTKRSTADQVLADFVLSDGEDEGDK